MPPLRTVLIAARDRLGAGPAALAESSAAALRELGLQVDLSGQLRPNVEGHDVVHAIDLAAPERAREQLEYFQLTGKPIVWQPRYLAGAGGPRIDPPALHAMAESADHVIVASAREAQALLAAAGLVSKPFTVVAPGIDDACFEASPRLFRDRFGAGSFVLCAEPIRPEANQLSLVDALRGTGLHLILAGPADDVAYLEACLRAGAENLSVLGAADRELALSAYAAARVHALAALGESATTASLEAAAAGCAIVVGCGGSEIERFGDRAYLCDPTSPESIREAVMTAYRRRPREQDRWWDLQERVRPLTRARAAEATVLAYRRALADRERGPLLGTRARSVRVLAYADELLVNPALLAAYGLEFSALDDVTLWIANHGSVHRLAALVESLGLDGEDAPDIVVAGAEAGGEEELAASCGLLLSGYARTGPVGRLRRFEESSVDALGRIARADAQRLRRTG